ncbi:MAG TPA: VOC family protein [Candidatus Tumulicola sp.]|jgi:catechol 2,3-dioxygenase-like lactoylglutathione lyase family enzyme
MRLVKLDHADVRVASIAVIEPFYDAVLMPLGLSRKQRAHVAEDGEWHDVDVAHPPNAVEYHTPVTPGEAGWFIGFIEDSSNVAGATRLAFSLDSEDDLAAVEPLVRAAGGRIVEWSADSGYPALFFEDPLGTRLEICARRPRS